MPTCPSGPSASMILLFSTIGVIGFSATMNCDPEGKYAKSIGGPPVGDAQSVCPSSSMRTFSVDDEPLLVTESRFGAVSTLSPNLEVISGESSTAFTSVSRPNPLQPAIKSAIPTTTSTQYRISKRPRCRRGPSTFRRSIVVRELLITPKHDGKSTLYANLWHGASSGQSPALFQSNRQPIIRKRRIEIESVHDGHIPLANS